MSERPSRDPRCPTCGRREPDPLLEVRGVPALCNALHASAEQALAAPRGDIELVLCPGCGLIWNAAFDAALVAYSPLYDNSLHFSEVFQGHATELAARLVERYDLHDKRIAEIGCGNGEFLAMLCAAGGNRGTGYDPSFDATRTRRGAHNAVRIEPRLFTSTDAADADFICCRHVLEHVERPRELVGTVRRAIGSRSGVAAYFEVPDAAFMLRAPAVWDLIYEHFAYFAAPTLRWLFESEGFDTLDLGTAFGGQYLWIDAAPAPRPSAASRPPRDELDALCTDAASFATAFREQVAVWDRRLTEMLDGGDVAVWGAGSKGVTFLNLVEAAAGVRYVVDVNPNKRGRHVPGSGQRIVAPEELAAEPPRHVIVMNPVYLDEVAAALRELGIAATLSSPGAER